MKYKSKTIEIVHNGKQEKVCVIASLSFNKVTKQEGYFLYIANSFADWDSLHSKPWINALFFKTPDEAFEMAEEILGTDPQIVSELIEKKMKA